MNSTGITPLFIVFMIAVLVQLVALGWLILSKSDDDRIDGEP